MYQPFMPLGQLNMGAASGPSGGASLNAAPAATGGAQSMTPPVVGPASTGTASPEVATTSQPGSASTQPKSQPGPFDGLMFPILVVVVIVLYFTMSRGPKKEEKRRKQMLSDLKKGDKVMTIGGLIARVVSVDQDEVVLKIDESQNVKATYSKKSIQDVITGDEKTN